MKIKNYIKNVLLSTGLYYKVNQVRFGIDRSQQSFYSRILTKKDLVFDIGANIGNKTQMFSRLCKKVIAIEPQTECVKHLISRFMFNHNVIIEYLAISDKRGEAIIFESDSHTLTSMSNIFINTVKKGRFKNNRWGKKFMVKTETLDNMIDLYGMPKFIKIDVEGYEFNVLNGLSKIVPFISFEFTPELINETTKCVERINDISKNYLYNYCLGEDLKYMLHKNMNYDNFVNKVIPQISEQQNFGDIFAQIEKS